MKKLSVFICSVALVVGFAGAANAYSFSKEIKGDWWFGTGKSYTWGFNFEPVDVYNVGFSMSFFDNESDRFAKEFADLIFDGNQLENRFEVNSGIRTWYGSNLLKLVTGRNFMVRMDGLGGDFRVRGLKFFGECRDDSRSVPVPEPGMMLMLGIALLGLVVVSRRRFNSKV
jgi:hypothetical protein